MRAQAGTALSTLRFVRRVDTSDRTDEYLMSAVGNGDRSALADIVRRYQNDIFRFCLYYMKDVEEAKELAQETFIRVYVARNRFDSGRKFRPWILCIARNLCLNELKRKRPVPVESVEKCAALAQKESGQLLRTTGHSPDEQMMAAERRAMVEEAINALDSESREIVVMRFFERLAARDIAEIIGSTEGAVRTRLHRILKSLREQYDGVKGDF